MSNRAVCYLRSSKDRSDISIDAQRRALHELASTRALVIVDEFVDAVESGKDEDRPGFQKLLLALKSQERAWEYVLVLDTSRIGRRRLLAQIFEQECSKRKAQIIYRSVPDTDPVTEMLLKAILQAMDEWHSLTSKQKGLAGMAENVRQGWRAGGRAPRGYKLVYHSTGAIRDGVAVTKSRLELDENVAKSVAAYLKLRAQGVARGVAIARTKLQWRSTSVHSMDWQALTYAGHTVWNMHADGNEGERRRPRAEWLIKHDTHEALITTEEAEAILKQQEVAAIGRRVRNSNLLLTGLVVSPDGKAWHSDGCNFYRIGKGRKVAAARLESAIMSRLTADLQADEVVERIRSTIAELQDEPISGHRLSGLEKRITTLTAQIGRTIDLASTIDDPTPVMRRVTDLEQQRAALVNELGELRARKGRQGQAATINAKQVRAMLDGLFADIADAPPGSDLRSQARLALSEVIEKIELDPETLIARMHYAVQTGDKVASPRGFEPLYSP